MQNKWPAKEPLHNCGLLEVSRRMTERIVLLFGWGPEEVGRTSSLLHLAETASSIDLEVRVFLYSEGVALARKGTAEKIDPDIGERFKRLLKNGRVKFYACSEAAHKRAIEAENLAPPVSMMGYTAFLDIAIEAKTVITV